MLQNRLQPVLDPNQLAREISGKMLIDGGMVGSITAAFVVLSVVGLHPWDGGSALALGLVVAVVAPLGDLCESLIKRDLGVKDLGGILPGHGGVLDRFDAMLFALPAVYYLIKLLGVVWPGLPLILS